MRWSRQPPEPPGVGLEASLLLCPRCRQAMPVRKRLLLILPEGEKYDYLCTRCAASCGTKIEPSSPRLVS